MDSDEEVLLLVLLLRQKHKRRRTRASPMFSLKYKTGDFYTLYPRLKESSAEFLNYFRMSRECFYELYHFVKNGIQRQETKFKNTISAEERLVITIRYLSTGCTMTDLHHSYQHGVSTISGVIKDTCQEIYKVLKDICIPDLKKEDWLQIAQGFETKANFPNCLGAIDGKHLRIIKPTRSGSLYYNYKHFFSIVLLAICDSNYKFIYIDVGSYGKASDSQIFRNSSFFNKLQNNNLDIPSPAPIQDNGPPLPFIFVGDEAFAVSNFIQRPFSGNFLEGKKKFLTTACHVHAGTLSVHLVL
ncbi:uncharacterized protein LOC124537751 [Vanessa cardui]|uniref:uncharacterized protein LOC124537751 n=1 Tax=Vanessa cardui TaxID=171605 RepID=UPI001F138E52|nr:uncharacterized protein LOC124537751 [Vanessa cardui]